MTSFDCLLAGSGLPRNESRALLEAASGARREWLIAHGDEPADPACEDRFRALVQRRLRGEPLAYLVGYREFYGRRFALTTDVLIPRPDTEVLTDWAVRHAPANARVLELGTGSGAIAVSLALERPDLSITATDISQAALSVACQNARRLDARSVRFLAGDWWAALDADADAAFDLVLSNPPYVARDDPHLRMDALPFEPILALASGHDGLDAIRAIIAGSAARLAHRGMLVLEHGYDQADAVRHLLSQSGFIDVFAGQDAGGHWRITGARVPGPDGAALTRPAGDP